MTDVPTYTRRRGAPLGFPAAVAVAAIILILIAATALLTRTEQPQTALVDLAGHPVRADSPTAAGSNPTESGVGRFGVPSVGLDIPLGALSVVDDTIEPPGFTSAYWIRNLGVSLEHSSTGTVFIAMHSLRGGGVAPGNYLIDVPHQRAKVQPGAIITVGTLRYRVTGTAAIKKTTIGTDSNIWANTPNRLVVITCLQRPQGGPSVDNMVIEAVRA